MSIRTEARMFDRVTTPIRMPDPKLWPDCPLCGCDVVRCECDPDEYAAGLVTADPEPPLSSERHHCAGADLAPGSGAREGSGTRARMLCEEMERDNG